MSLMQGKTGDWEVVIGLMLDGQTLFALDVDALFVGLVRVRIRPKGCFIRYPVTGEGFCGFPGNG